MGDVIPKPTAGTTRDIWMGWAVTENERTDYLAVL